MIGGPILAGLLLVRRYGFEQNSLRVFLGGAGAFIVAEVILVAAAQITGASGLLTGSGDIARLGLAITYGISIGIVEEGANYVILRVWLRDARSWAQGLMLGVGHGGAEAMLAGITTLVWYVTMLSLRSGPPPGQTLTDTDRTAIDATLSAYFGTAWPLPVAAALQQLFLLALAVGLASLVMHSFLSGRAVFVPLAMGLHAFATTATIVAGQFGVTYSMMVAAACGALGLWIAYRLRPAVTLIEQPAAPAVTTVAVGPAPKPARPRRKRTKRAS